MMGLARDPDRWKCGVDFLDVTNIDLMFDGHLVGQHRLVLHEVPRPMEIDQRSREGRRAVAGDVTGWRRQAGSEHRVLDGVQRQRRCTSRWCTARR